MQSEKDRELAFEMLRLRKEIELAWELEEISEEYSNSLEKRKQELLDRYYSKYGNIMVFNSKRK